MKINVHIENGYGILEFDHDFTFSDKSNFYSLYAQNGTMKSSFAKVLEDYSKDIPIKDHLFPVHQGKCVVTGVDKHDILSFPCFDGKVELTDEASALVSNDVAKKAYDEAFRDVSKAYQVFVGKLVEVTQTSSSDAGVTKLLEEMYRTFISEDRAASVTVPNIIQLLRTSAADIDSGDLLFCDISHGRFVHSNFTKFIDNKKYRGFFNDLGKAYDEFRSSPTYYRKGFDASSAVKLIKALGDSKYFEAEHTVALKDGSGQTSDPIQDVGKLESLLKTDFDIIIEKNPNLKSPLTALINDFSVGTNGDVRDIFEDPSKRRLLVFMGDRDRFYKNMWYGYWAGCIDEIKKLLDVYKDSSDRITKALENAKDCVSEWEEIVEIFNNRFRNLPYRIDISNKPDAIVNELVTPVFEIKFENPRNIADPYREKPDEYNRLIRLGTILSNGERKALYLLNIMFKLRNQIKKQRDTLVIFDDIVESFDYKNKYAFFEYLQDLSDEDNRLYIIVLTHNFDFYRLMHEKLYPKVNEQFKIILKSRDNRLVVQPMFNPKVFGELKARAETDESAWVSLIPFARNLVEYRYDAEKDHYKTLTKCLHAMPGILSIGDIRDVIKKYTGVSSSVFDDSRKVYDVISDVAGKILQDPDDSFDLYKNITLAIATRLEIERYIISHITDDQYQSIIAKQKHQTRKLINIYKNHSRDINKQAMLDLFNHAVMMVDGSIHINSFMYEPLIDMGTWELKEMLNNTRQKIAEVTI